MWNCIWLSELKTSILCIIKRRWSVNGPFIFGHSKIVSMHIWIWFLHLRAEWDRPGTNFQPKLPACGINHTQWWWWSRTQCSFVFPLVSCETVCLTDSQKPKVSIVSHNFLVYAIILDFDKFLGTYFSKHTNINSCKILENY